jgi:hypothetical protein
MNSTTTIQAAPRCKFRLGQTYQTHGAQDAMTRHNVSPAQLLNRHLAKDWGNLSDFDKQANEEALQNGTRLLSAYEIAPNCKVWIITEGDRSATTILLPDEY